MFIDGYNGKRPRGRPRKHPKTDEHVAQLIKDHEALRDKLETYEDRLGKIQSPYSSGKLHDHTEFYNGDTVRIALISDTHLCSTHERLSDLRAAYKIMEAEKVTACYHAGDLIAGQGIYKGQENEVKEWGFDAQSEYAINHYPRTDKFKTYCISGNHDLSFLQRTGADPLLRITRHRDDLVYLDQMEADVMVTDKIKLRLWHGGRGSYARSYSTQKYIDGLEGGTKPQILACGHLHVAFNMDYRNIYAFQVGAFERQTLFLKRLGIMPSCSFWLLEFHIHKGTINRMKSELVKFF
jgi:predicted phosphodiesterase